MYGERERSSKTRLGPGLLLATWSLIPFDANVMASPVANSVVWCQCVVRFSHSHPS